MHLDAWKEIESLRDNLKDKTVDMVSWETLTHANNFGPNNQGRYMNQERGDE